MQEQKEDMRGRLSGECRMYVMVKAENIGYNSNME